MKRFEQAEEAVAVQHFVEVVRLASARGFRPNSFKREVVECSKAGTDGVSSQEPVAELMAWATARQAAGWLWASP